MFKSWLFYFSFAVADVKHSLASSKVKRENIEEVHERLQRVPIGWRRNLDACPWALGLVEYLRSFFAKDSSFFLSLPSDP